DLGVCEEPVGIAVQEDRVIARAVSSQHLLEFRPDGVVAALVFVLMAGFESHQKCFSDHFGLLPDMLLICLSISLLTSWVLKSATSAEEPGPIHRPTEP